MWKASQNLLFNLPQASSTQKMSYFFSFILYSQFSMDST